MENKFKDLVFYEIYPTSFFDSNNDGIGDLKGIEQKLDYVKELGCNAIWLNPFFKSPFKDGGYDIEDFFDVDERFGTIEDFKSLLNTAHKKGIKIILDLVAGHASTANKEFIKSAEPTRNEYSDLFIWNDGIWNQEPGLKLIAGMYQRNGCYLVNFFAHQPAFNYGFNRVDYKWQMSYKDERTFLARNYILNVMRFWLKLGVDGFRVDMADSLVKNDDEKEATIEVWHYLFDKIRKEYPNSFFVAEWSNPEKAFKAGFDCDFVLDHWDNYYHRLFRSNGDTRGISAINGGNDMGLIIRDLSWRVNESIKNNALLGNISGNHDTSRIANYLNEDQLRLFYLFMISLPGTPFILYGDELGMKSSNIPSKDGGFNRTGTRIPMIWNNKEINHGFSKTNKETYLPFNDENKCSVEDAINDKNSLYYFIKKVIELKKNNNDLKDIKTSITESERIIEIKRGERTKIIVNLSDQNHDIKTARVLISSREILNGILPPVSAVIIEE